MAAPPSTSRSENVLTPPRTNGRDSGDGLDIPEFLRRA